MRYARKAATVPTTENLSCEVKPCCFNVRSGKSYIECDINFEILFKRYLRKSTPKWCQILEKSTFGAVLEHFGHPLGAKMAQERHQEQNLMKNTQF